MRKALKITVAVLVLLGLIGALTSPDQQKSGQKAASSSPRDETRHVRPASFRALARAALARTDGDVLAARCRPARCDLAYYLAPPDPSLYDRSDYPAVANGELRPLWRALHRAKFKRPTRVTVVTDIAPETGPIAKRITIYRVTCEPTDYDMLAQGYGTSVICR